MSGHTPGPWSYRSQRMGDWGVVRAGRDWICQAKDPRAISDEQLAEHRAAKTDPWEANARLIAAAPELLEALQQSQAILERLLPNWSAETAKQIRKNAAALTKASPTTLPTEA